MEEISIYQDKDTDKIIYQRTRSNALKSLNIGVKYACELEQEEKNSMIKSICQFILPDCENKKQIPFLFKLYKSEKFNFTVKISIVDFISRLYLENLDFVKNHEKLIIKTFLFENLDEASESI